MNYKKIYEAAQRAVDNKDEIAIELEKKIDKRQKEYDQNIIDSRVSYREMNTRIDF